MKARRNRGARGALIVLCVFLGLVLAVMLAVTIFAVRMINLVNRPADTPQENLSQEQLSLQLRVVLVKSIGLVHTLLLPLVFV